MFDFTQPVDPALPRVAYVTQCQTQGTYSNTFLYGKEVSNLVPAAYSPTELMDGCIVSGNYVWPWAKIPTFIQANMPVVMELSRAHGKTRELRRAWSSTGATTTRTSRSSGWPTSPPRRCAAWAPRGA